jgi:hypothetical protein
MNPLCVITEEDEEIPEECSEIVTKLKDELRQAEDMILKYQKQFERLEQNEMRVKELMGLCQAKNTEIFALERKVKDLTDINEEKDKQIISMLSMVKDYKFLVESSDRAVQTERGENDFKEKIKITEDKNEKIKELIASQADEIQKLRNDGSREGLMFNGKKKIEVRTKNNGYCPLFLRKPKDSMV